MTPRSARIPTPGTIEGGGRGRQDGKGDDPKRGGKRGGACQAWTARALARAGREPGKASGSDERMAHGRRGWLMFDGAHIAGASNATCLPSAITLATSCDPLQANEREGLQLRSRREERRQCAWSGRDRTSRTRAITAAHSRTLVWLRPAACQAAAEPPPLRWTLCTSCAGNQPRHDMSPLPNMLRPHSDKLHALACATGACRLLCHCIPLLV